MNDVELTDRTYRPAADYLDRRRRTAQTVVICTALIPFVVVATSASRAPWTFALPFALLMSVMLALPGAALSWYMLRQVRSTQLALTTRELLRTVGTRRQSVPWDAVTHVRVHHGPSGEPSMIIVRSTASRPLMLAGFGSMPELVEQIRARVAPTAELTVRTHRVLLDRPWHRVALIAAGIATVLVLDRTFGPRQVQPYMWVLNIGLAAWMVGYGPISRENPPLRWLEFVLALVWVGPVVGTLLSR